MAFADVDLDHDPDLVVLDFFGVSAVQVFLNDGDGNFGTPTTYAPGVSVSLNAIVRLADLNEDGAPDIVVMPFANGRVSILLNDGTGQFGPGIEVPTGGSTSSLHLADADADGDGDVIVTDHAGDRIWVLENLTLTSTDVVVSASEGTFGLGLPHPNPSSTVTDIALRLPASAPVRVTIHDGQGRHVRTLIDEVRPAGLHELRWDGRTQAGQRVPSGVYFARMVSAGSTDSRKLTWIR